ncbi:hypothetical protein EB077_09045 [bacterium]|nr:hypothetical protein [bacterium]
MPPGVDREKPKRGAPNVETIDRLVNLLDEAQKALDVLAGYVAAPATIGAAYEATEIAMRIRAGMRAARIEQAEQENPGPNPPGYPGPCPEGMDWGQWLAMNNVD